MLCLKRWVCEEHPEVQTAVGGLVHNYDRDDYESMAGVVDVYNKAVRAAEPEPQNHGGSFSR